MNTTNVPVVTVAVAPIVAVLVPLPRRRGEEVVGRAAPLEEDTAQGASSPQGVAGALGAARRFLVTAVSLK